MNDIIKGVRSDLSIIHDEEIIVFFQRCWSSEPSERTNFIEICKILQKENFKLAFNADELEILKYNYWFNDCLENKNVFYYFQKAANLGNSEGMIQMGRMLLSGELVAVNKKRALEYFLMASDLGNIQAMHEYANMLMSEDGPETDYEKAGDYFKTAAFYGNVSSMRNYGLMLKNGKLPSDFKKSAYYLEKAAKLGDYDAIYHYGNLLCVMALLGNCSNKKTMKLLLIIIKLQLMKDILMLV